VREAAPSRLGDWLEADEIDAAILNPIDGVSPHPPRGATAKNVWPGIPDADGQGRLLGVYTVDAVAHRSRLTKGQLSR